MWLGVDRNPQSRKRGQLPFGNCRPPPQHSAASCSQPQLILGGDGNHKSTPWSSSVLAITNQDCPEPSPSLSACEILHGFRTGKSRSKRRPLVFCVGMYTFCNSAWTAHIVTDTVMWCFPSPAERHGQTGQSQKAKTHHFWDADETSLR